MRVLVTGGAGYIGSVLVPALLRRGDQVTVLDDFRYAQTSLVDCCYDEGLSLVRGDVRDERLLGELVPQADVIIPLAALVGAPLCDRYPREAEQINLGAIEALLAVRRREQPVIIPTTNSGYGIGTEGVPCTEESPLRPVSHYGRLKVAAEERVLSSGNSISLRLATVFGASARMRLDLLVNDFTYRAVNDRFLVLFEAHFKRNYLHVRDAARAFMHCIDNFDSMRDNVYNVGLSEANLSKWELCERIKQHVPDFYFIEAEVGSDPDKRNYIVSNDKIEAAGFRPEFGLDAGIRELVKAYTVVRRHGFANV